jgi:DNA-binding transcriptional LysR family regulator
LPAAASQIWRIAASDYLDPLFLPELVARVRAQAPGVTLDLLPLTRDYDYRGHLARGEVDLVVGNWLAPPEELHLGRLVSDEIVCLVSQSHSALRNPRQWTVERYLASEHIAPTPLHAGGVGVVDEHLQAQGLQRRIVVRSPHFGLAPAMVARTSLVLTTGRQFCSRYIDKLPVRILRCPVVFPPLTYYQLWHDLTHASPAVRWLREQVRDVARELAGGLA